MVSEASADAMGDLGNERAAVYNRLVSKLEVASIWLGSAFVRAREDYSSGPSLTLVPHINADQAEYENTADGFVVRHKLFFFGVYVEETEPAITMALELCVRYHSDQSMDDDLFTLFRTRNVPVNTWPYFREMVQSFLARTGYPVLTLPAFQRPWGDDPWAQEELPLDNDRHSPG